jgi:4-aminobutyrate aminotransferase
MSVPDIKTSLPGPKAKALIERDAKVVTPSYTRGYPLVIDHAWGSTVEDVDGNLFLDCAAGIAVNSTGHSHPDVVKAIVDQAGRFLHMSGTDFYYEPQVRLAEEIAAIVPIEGGVKSFFGNSGTERRGFGPLMAGVYHAPYADCYRCPVGLKPETCAAECLDYIEHQIFVHLLSPDEVAAIVVEPIQGEGGYIVAPDQFLQRLRELTRTEGMLLVVDEVQSGMGRTGKMFAIEHARVQPDVVAIAKGVASGMPLGVTAARADLMTWPPGAHASTFGGNPVSCAAALVTIKLLKDRLIANAADVGAHLMAGLNALRDKHLLIGDVRGRGLMVGVELVRSRETKERATDERNAVVTAAFRRGLLILGAGKNSIRFSPPLVFTRDEADTAIGLFDQALTEVEATPR